jgi:hypothetical protein
MTALYRIRPFTAAFVDIRPADTPGVYVIHVAPRLVPTLMSSGLAG